MQKIKDSNIVDMVESKIAIRAHDIKKNYGHLMALRGANLELRSGEILALVGDNGAGKSTLAKIICGAIAKDNGHLFFWDEKVDVQSIQHAHELGVYTVYQDLSLAPDLSISDSFFLGREIIHSGFLGGLGFLNRKEMIDSTKEALARLGIGLKQMRVRTNALSGGERQALAVARAVTWASTALIMDEPTAALGTRQSSIVYKTMRAAAERGLAVMAISHDIPKMIEVADRIAVMRHGLIIKILDTKKTNLNEVISLMLGGNGANDE